jgi:hypothetical protein
MTPLLHHAMGHDHLFLAGTLIAQPASDVTTTQPPASQAVAEGQASSCLIPAFDGVD